MKISGPSALASTIALASLLPACSSGGGGSNGPMFVQTCSLGCSNGQGGLQVNCSIIQTFINQEITVVFSEPIDPATVDSTTFQIIDVSSGQVPVGTRLVDAADPHKLIFRPAVTFDSIGNASFGFEPNTTYRVTIPGTAQSAVGPFVQSVGGKENESKLQCDIQTTQGVNDPVPGDPVVAIKVDQAIPGTPDPNDIIPNIDADGAVDVWTQTTVRFVFGDVMNPVTLANPITHLPAFASIEVDVDGNAGTTTDRVTLSGEWVVEIDLTLLQTLMTFTATNGIPSGGALQPDPRIVVITLPDTIQDLAGNPLQNDGIYFFTPEIIAYPPSPLPDVDGENFTDQDNMDAPKSGADWAAGRLQRGYGGGSGRLGELLVVTNQTVVLNTTSTLFRNLSSPTPVNAVPTSGLIDNSLPLPAVGGYNPLDETTWPTVLVNDGIFEFSSIVVEAGGTLQLTGTSHARLFSRGPVSINGTVDVRGETPVPYGSTTAQGQVGGLGGPLAGGGGKGGDRPNNAANSQILNLPLNDPQGFEARGISNPGAIIDGQPGNGVGNNGNFGAGAGGLHFPDTFPVSTAMPGPGTAQQGTLAFTDTGDCLVRQIASPGGGGAYATDGQSAAPTTPNPVDTHNVSNLPTFTAGGGLSSDIGLESADPQAGHIIRKLEAVLAVPGTNLRGGAGGGGGGTSLYNTASDGFAPGCDGPPPPAIPAKIIQYRDHSAAGGGGGGGAVQIVSGQHMQLAGTIKAQGGDGGSNLLPIPPPDNGRISRAMPGGGGAGGAVRLQARVLDITALNPGRIDVSGGFGGVNFSQAQIHGGATISLGRGGDGGAGLIRLEDFSSTIGPPPATLLTRCSEAPKVLPFDPLDLNPNTPLGDPCNPVGGPQSPEAEDILSVGAWVQPRRRPESFSGAVSCWMKPPGSFFVVEFAPDVIDGGNPANNVYGWNMEVRYDDGSPAGGPVSLDYRTGVPADDPNYPALGGADFEAFLGNNVNYLGANGTGNVDTSTAGSYLAVRFQGALATADISANPCDVELSGVTSQIDPGSLTPWVRHPAELNAFFPRPNMIRFCIVFDFSKALGGATVESFIKGVTNLIIQAQPD